MGNILNSVPWWVYVIAAFFLIGYIKKRFSQTIHTFAAEGNIRAIKKIAKSNGISCLETADASGHTPLYFASLNGHQELVELLLSYDVAVNASTIGGLTPLHGAAVGGHLDVIKLLLKKGADLNSKRAELSVLDSALCHGHKDCADYLQSLGVQSHAAECVFAAAAIGDLKGVNRFLDAGVNPNSKIDDEPLIALPVMRGHKEMVELLLAKGADLDDSYMWGMTMLDLATNIKMDGAVDSLMDGVADLLKAENALMSCGRCRKPFRYDELRKLWRFPLWILKMVRMHPGAEAECLYCRLCARSQNLGVFFLMSLAGAMMAIVLAAVLSK